MSFPEWGRSYNALHVPLTSDWQCSLVPAQEVNEPTAWWSLSYDERQRKRKEREEQIEQDRRTFDQLFRVSTSRDAACSCSDFRAYAAFITEHLRISGLAAPVDGEGVTRILRDAVRDGRLVPSINFAWRGTRRVSRPYGPQSWPKRLPDPKPIVYGVRNGQLIPLNADGSFVDHTPYVPIKVRAAAEASSATSAGGGAFDCLGAVEAAVRAAAETAPRGIDDSGLGFISDDSGDASTPFDAAEVFEYGGGESLGGDSFDIAKTPNEGEPGTWYTNPGSGQMRMYGGDRQPLVDFDFDHDHGQGNPHAHNWSDGARGSGLPFSLLP
ncbi:MULTISPECIES: hypothetical protein [unclassified Paraburkholderia]|uniref:hypothetical protein n=1 Tax=unclassified Paraburkholderia TaxID=2615204 RepID=UPI002AB2E0EE|nr:MULTISPECIES: hypothetical protein [unclassified Paraburkholderia]